MLEQLYKRLFGVSPDRIEPINKAGSNRQYFRLFGPETVVGVIGTSIEENRAFIYFANQFFSKGLPMPKVLNVSDDEMAYLQTDLGNTSLFQCKDDLELLKNTIRILPDIQYLGGKNLNYNFSYPTPSFDFQSILWDLNYFKYCFLNTSHISYREDLLENDFRKMAELLSVKDYEQTFMYRDFQSRNVMIKNGRPYFIDFQGGRRGPAIYDLVSFVNQAKAAFSEETKQILIETYIESAGRYENIDKRQFMSDFRMYSLLRNLQVLGAYGFRGRFEQKPHFIESIRFGLDSLSSLICKPFTEFPYLQSVLLDMIDKEKETMKEPLNNISSPLTVTVCSFSFKKGIPADESGNGGGFVFDCRGMENPGRYNEYKTLTGLDEEVKAFLEGKGEIQKFLSHCYALVDESVNCYISRGFTSLCVNFGCTGGQHRSVYAAEHMGEHLHSRYPNIKVHLIHREQNIDRLL